MKITIRPELPRPTECANRQFCKKFLWLPKIMPDNNGVVYLRWLEVAEWIQVNLVSYFNPNWIDDSWTDLN